MHVSYILESNPVLFVNLKKIDLCCEVLLQLQLQLQAFKENKELNIYYYYILFPNYLSF